MSGNSKISWTDATWNCLLGCSRVSAGCDNCFAIRSAHRLQSNPNPKVSSAFEGLTTVKGRGLDWTAQVRCLPDRLEAPLHWKKPRRIFVNSLSDLFHPQVPDDFIDQVFAVMALCPQHTFQILTKRPERMRDYLSGGGTVSRVLRLKIDLIREHGSRQERFNLASSCWSPPIRWPLPNVHVGVSCENQATADERIPSLVDAPADVRFLSLEPLLGPINLDPWIGEYDCMNCGYRGNDCGEIDTCQQCGEPMPPGDDPVCKDCGPGAYDLTCPKCGVSRPDFGYAETNRELEDRQIDWVIAGGESGPGARPLHPAWVRSLRDQCQRAGVPYFWKQWGEWIPKSHTTQRHPWHAEKFPGAWPVFVADGENPPWGTIEHSGEFFPETTCWNGHDDDSPTSGAVMFRVGKHRAGCTLDGREHHEMPAIPSPEVSL